MKWPLAMKVQLALIIIQAITIVIQWFCNPAFEPMNTKRNWMCMGVGWLAAILAWQLLMPNTWWAAVLCFSVAFGTTLIAQWISRL